MIEEDELVSTLRRIFRGGGMRRLPGKREDAAVIMALSVSNLDAEAFFDEAELNLHLLPWLKGISAEDGGLDAVTFRRYLVDFGFLRRSSDGVIYRVSSDRIDEVLSKTAREIDPQQVLAEMQTARAQRGASQIDSSVQRNKRKQQIKDYKATPKDEGVYRIRNTVNGKSHIASSRDIQARFNRHRMELKTGTESAKLLLSDWVEHGEAAFEFEVVDLLEPLTKSDYDPAEDLKVLESLWLEKLQSYEPDGYNRRRKEHI